MNNFTYYAPTKVVFGKGSEKQTGELIKSYQAKKVLIHYGSESAKRTGLLDRIMQSLQDAGITYVSLGGVVPNPRLSLVYEGIELCKKEEVDFILAVGGGSVIDSAKAIAWGSVLDGDVWDLFMKTAHATDALPIASVLTIAAAGSEMSSGSVVTKDEGGLKRDYGHENIRPKFAIMNPELTMTLPDYQTACGCVDILMHTLERYFVQGETMEITRSIAEALMRTVIDNSLILYKDPSNYAARAEIMWASSLSHNDLTGCGNARNDFATHMLEHEVGGLYDVAHGAGLAALWGSWARYVYKDCLTPFVSFATKVMKVEQQENQEEMALQGIEALEAFFSAIDMPTSMSQMNIEVNEEQLRHMAKSCSEAGHGSIGSAKSLQEEDMYLIFKAAI